MNYLSVENISKNYGEKVLFENLSFGIEKGQRVALVARNGSGKTTLLRVLTGKEPQDSGQVTLRKEVRVGFLEQDIYFDPDITVLQAVIEADNPAAEALRRYNECVASGDPAALEKATDEMHRTEAWDYESNVKQVLGKLGLQDTQITAGRLSGGQKKRLALARVLIARPDLMILDEPTNHLDLDMIEWLEGFLSAADITLFMVTHDRYFLERVCNEILELEGGQLYRYKGNYSYFLEKKNEREENEQANLARAKNQFRKELEWMRRQPKARGTKSKARVDAFYDLKDKATKRTGEEELDLQINMQRIGGKILEIHRLGKAYGEKNILEAFSYVFKRGEKIGIVGANGAGKSTFLNMILGLEAYDRGKITVGETVVFGYYSQDGIAISEGKRVIEVIKDIGEFIPMAGGKRLYASQLLERFLFPPHTHYQYVSKLSGGEKRRLYLLTILMKNPNFLILDEPTNDLDIFTLAALEEYLENFEGCVLVVTHDRYFMDRIVDHIFVFEGQGQIRDILGNYTEYREYHKQLQAEERRQRKEEKEEAPLVSREKTESNTAAKKKPSFKDKYEFDQLEREIPELEARRAQLEARLNSVGMELEDISTVSAELGKLLQDIEEKTLRWIELAEKI